MLIFSWLTDVFQSCMRCQRTMRRDHKTLCYYHFVFEAVVSPGTHIVDSDNNLTTPRVHTQHRAESERDSRFALVIRNHSA